MFSPEYTPSLVFPRTAISLKATYGEKAANRSFKPDLSRI